MERRIGQSAYVKCKQYRIIATIFELIAFTNYIVYFFYPLPVPLPQTFPWDWRLSITIAVVIAIPSSYLMWQGIKDAGEETIAPKKEHALMGASIIRLGTHRQLERSFFGG